ncbi:hypothetical protein NDU88_006490 [Pleurodeles waltl]|uniref:Uncharacterized protein n=1 Tax=Pleurodeles waltl TaxID=8319 RepID=A0AAV7TX92_PLEWA|nr:hypothetical protein NDU88_006490 [Pleurodeles waltl]
MLPSEPLGTEKKHSRLSSTGRGERWSPAARNVNQLGGTSKSELAFCSRSTSSSARKSPHVITLTALSYTHFIDLFANSRTISEDYGPNLMKVPALVAAGYVSAFCSLTPKWARLLRAQFLTAWTTTRLQPPAQDVRALHQQLRHPAFQDASLVILSSGLRAWHGEVHAQQQRKDEHCRAYTR